MAIYRYQCVQVGYWRGQIKRWNTTFHGLANDLAAQLHGLLQKSCYPNPGDVTGDCSGGQASITWYNASGGAPIGQIVYFDWQVPTEWIPFTGELWASVPEGTPLDASGESAAVVVGTLPGLSSTGKPMTTRRYIHAIPSRTAAAFDDPDIDAATVAAFKAAWLAGLMRPPGGILPNSVDLEPYYGNHQRVRGRRRTTKSVAAQAFSQGVVTGAATGGFSGGGSFPAGGDSSVMHVQQPTPDPFFLP